MSKIRRFLRNIVYFMNLYQDNTANLPGLVGKPLKQKEGELRNSIFHQARKDFKLF